MGLPCRLSNLTRHAAEYQSNYFLQILQKVWALGQLNSHFDNGAAKMDSSTTSRSNRYKHFMTAESFLKNISAVSNSKSWCDIPSGRNKSLFDWNGIAQSFKNQLIRFDSTIILLLLPARKATSFRACPHWTTAGKTFESSRRITDGILTTSGEIRSE
jgi:hypothetical protein